MSNLAGVLAQLSTPARYLQVTGNAKPWIDYGVPVLLTMASVPILVFIPAAIVSSGGLVERVNELLQVLVGFYVASLAVVSSIPSVALNQNVKQATLDGAALSRRRFLSFLFGYLSLASLALYVLGVLAALAKGPLGRLAEALPASRIALITTYTFFCWHLVCVTLLGLHYLVDQVYKPDPLVYKSPPADSTEPPKK